MSTEEQDKPSPPVDVLARRLAQCEGVLIALDCTYDDDSKGYLIPAVSLREALWGVGEMIRDARSAFAALLDQREAVRRAAQAPDPRPFVADSPPLKAA